MHRLLLVFIFNFLKASGQEQSEAFFIPDEYFDRETHDRSENLFAQSVADDPRNAARQPQAPEVYRPRTAHGSGLAKSTKVQRPQTQRKT